MRKPQHESAHEPERRCIITGDRAPRAGLIRLALGPDDVVLPDVRAKAPGRGAWIGVDRAELEATMAKGKFGGALSRAFKSKAKAPDDLPQRIESVLERAALERLGLEARASMLLTGSDKIDQAARKGQVFLLLHASDAGEDGCKKLDQSWRVGSDAEGTGKAGITVAADRSQLSLALGRENVVHIAIIDAKAADRVSQCVSRWHHFIGREAAGLAESGAKVHGDGAHAHI